MQITFLSSHLRCGLYGAGRRGTCEDRCLLSLPPYHTHDSPCLKMSRGQRSAGLLCNLTAVRLSCVTQHSCELLYHFLLQFRFTLCMKVTHRQTVAIKRSFLYQITNVVPSASERPGLDSCLCLRLICCFKHELYRINLQPRSLEVFHHGVPMV